MLHVEQAQGACINVMTVLFMLQDVFSLGCVLAELFLDGRALFDLGTLLAYKKREWDPAVQVCRFKHTELIVLCL